MNPLVTIAVATYNSSKFIIETLESAKNQTYENIELIISDDCSKDNTVEICRKWTVEHKSRFKSVKIITSEINTGVSANCNRLFYAANGEWIKGIAGDDILFPNCIENYINYINQNNQIRILLGIRRSFGANIDNALEDCYKERSRAFLELPSATDQYWDLIIRNSPVFSCTAFIRKDIFVEVGGYDESIPMCEDAPFWIKLTKFGYRLNLMPKETVFYRIHDGSIVHSKTKKGKNIGFQKILFDIFLKYRYPALKSIDCLYANVMCLLYLRRSSENVKKVIATLGYYMYKFIFYQKKKIFIRNTQSLKENISINLISILKAQGYIK